MKQLNRIERKGNKVPQNFMSDTYKFLDSLNKMNTMENIDQTEIMEAINEFTTSFVYLRESMNPRQSNIQGLNRIINEINQLIDQSGKEYENSNQSKAIDILESTMNEIINYLNEMNDKLQDAEQEETESKRIEAIERMFVGAKTDIKATEEVINRTRGDLLDIEGSLNASADAMRDSVEQVDKKMSMIENQTKEFKVQCDGIIQTGNNWQKAFETWQEISTEKTKEGIDKLTQKLDQTQRVFEEKSSDEIKSLSDRYERVYEKIEKKGDDALDKIDAMIDSVKSNIASDGFRQVFSMIGGGFSLVNFIILLIILFIK
ncbi:hypothetical protein [Acetobacterium woodii]|uniref:Uncharacterized protein n=1 Tax=Acetobacterium woodii (strain ATCC 29683 / DSM 1030 / JCM 2381 / KCTC 1655 / WB1) TaxID=931626 RepID=H6LDG3_ACEWD|nr:hypothetical protein [Acetobacterium woodii]AFA47935.1 hypothetical protein Awo_c11510 [Acetobacterium woodii DSM 1030]